MSSVIRKISFTLAATLLLANLEVNASHAVGADLSFLCLGGNQYQLTLNLYRDCAGVSAPSSANMSISSVTCGVNTSISLPLQSSTEVSQLCPSQLNNSSCSGGSLPGIEQYIYSGTFTFPAQCTDWMMSYSLCCRNSAITNLSNANGFSLYVEAHLDNTVSGGCQNSPVFTTLPIPYICNNQPFFFNHGVVDIDGDSLVYSMINPLTGNNQPVGYNSGLNVATPMNLNGSFSFDTQTGQMSFTPNGLQQAVVTVLVEEYRNGVLIGSTMRDIQIIVINCVNAAPVATGIDGSNNFSVTICAGFNLCFDIYTSDANADNVSLSWNQGIPAGTFNTSTGGFPTGTFCWTPTTADIGTHNFSVSLIDDACPIFGTGAYVYTVIVEPLISRWIY